MDPIMSQLPNNLIMNIIRMADGGLSAHKKKFIPILNGNLKRDAHMRCYFIRWDRKAVYRTTEEYMKMVRNHEEYSLEYGRLVKAVPKKPRRRRGFFAADFSLRNSEAWLESWGDWRTENNLLACDQYGTLFT